LIPLQLFVDTPCCREEVNILRDTDLDFVGLLSIRISQSRKTEKICRKANNIPQILCDLDATVIPRLRAVWINAKKHGICSIEPAEGKTRPPGLLLENLIENRCH
jgi:hypothetical protein